MRRQKKMQIEQLRPATPLELAQDKLYLAQDDFVPIIRIEKSINGFKYTSEFNAKSFFDSHIGDGYENMYFKINGNAAGMFKSIHMFESVTEIQEMSYKDFYSLKDVYSPEDYDSLKNFESLQGSPTFRPIEIYRSELSEEFRHKGHGIHFYGALFETAKRLGATHVFSDDELSPDAIRIWQKLSTIYHVGREYSAPKADGWTHRFYADLRRQNFIDIKAA